MVRFWRRRSHHLVDSVAPRSTRVVVLTSLDEMDFDAVEALWLVDICDLSYRDAAAATRAPVTVFAQRLHDARRELRRNYASWFGV
ncbi:MAG: hypothetical protein HKN03_01210 [Acidimicrobiales bacterium]|nr:hypothetical protein [Acidimicrobiales bacterium]